MLIVWSHDHNFFPTFVQIQSEVYITQKNKQSGEVVEFDGNFRKLTLKELEISSFFISGPLLEHRFTFKVCGILAFSIEVKSSYFKTNTTKKFKENYSEGLL